jgi:valyl-tRNA synthetase
MKDLVRPAIQAVEENKIQFIPDRWTKVYINWMENHRDWCISRQIWWGHRIPAWFCECGEIIVSEEIPIKCPKCGGTKLMQDPDVLDTWFSSSLWPFSTLGWPASVKTSAGKPDEYIGDLKTYYPTSVLVTGYDIITFWVSKMIVMGLKFMKKEPFSKIFIHGLIRDITGKKMSKSLGNIIDPINVIERVGADALRFALITLITGQGQDIKLSENKITEARNFSNKIWNAARYIFGRRSGDQEIRGSGIADKWILSRYNRTIEKVTSCIENYDPGEGARSLYEFIWSEYCDWYIELSKIEASQEVAVSILEGTLRLLHPFMPFITEEVWQKMEAPNYKSQISIKSQISKSKTIMLAEWPSADKSLIDEKIEEEMDVIRDVVKAVRNIRATLNIPHSTQLAAVIITSKKITAQQEKYIMALAKFEKIEIHQKAGKKIEGAATAVLPGMNIFIPLKGIIDLNKEIERLNSKIASINDDLDKLNIRIDSAKNIPEDVLEEWKERKKEFLKQKEILSDQIKSLSS